MSQWSSLLSQLDIELLSCHQAEALAPGALRLCPLPHKALLQVAGPQAKTFLQGQLSCDLDEVTAEHWRLGAHCDHKGRMHSSLIALAPSSELVWLRLNQNIADTALAALAKYIVFSKADIERRPDLLGLGLSGPRAAAALSQLAPALSGPGSCAALANNSGQILQTGPERFELWAPIEEITNTLTEFKSKLKYEATLVDKDYWRLLDIRAGIGEIQAGSEAMFIPQMLNFNERGGISYDKGCYTGQEIIARMQYRGNLKRHLLYLHSDTANTAPTVGQALYNGQKEQAIGYIVDALLSSKGIEALAVCSDESADQAVYTETQGGPSYRAQTLSYAIT